MNKHTIIPLSLLALAAAPGIAFACKQPPKLPPPPPPVEQPPVVLPPPPPVVTIPPPVTVTPPPPVRVALSCAELRQRKAGRRWLVQYRCVGIKTTRMDCRTLRANGAGRKSLIARRCVLRARPGVPAVTG